MITALTDMTPAQRRRWARIQADVQLVGNEPKNQARREQRDGRVLVLPPEGYGNRWSGGAR